MLPKITNICKLKYIYMFDLFGSKEKIRGKIHMYIYKKTFTTEHLIQCLFLPEDQICPGSDNETDKSDQLVCILYKK